MRKYIRYIIIAVIATIIAVIMAIPRDIHLDCVTSSIYGNDNSIYCIEEGDTNYKIYHISSDGEYIGEINGEKITKRKNYNLYSQLFYDDGKVYVYRYTESFDKKTGEKIKSKYTICECDFKNEKLIEKWSFIPKTSIYKIIIRDNTFYYIEYENNETDNTGIFSIYSAQKEKTPTCLTQYKMKNAYICEEIFYDTDKNIIFRTNSGNIYKLSQNDDDNTYETAKQIYPLNNVKYAEASTLRFSDNGINIIYAIDNKNDCVIRYDTLTDKVKLNNSGINQMLNENGNSLSDIRWISFQEDGGFISSIERDEDSFHICCYDTESGLNIIDKISPNTSALKIILKFIIFFLIFIILQFLTLWILHIMKNRYIPITARMFILLLIFTSITFSCFSSKIENFIKIKFNQFQIEDMMYIIIDRAKFLNVMNINSTELMKFNWDRFSEGNESDENIYKDYIVDVLEAENFTCDDVSIQQYYMSIYLTDSKKDSNLTLFMNTQMSMDVSIEYTMHDGTGENIKNCVKTGKMYTYQKYEYDRLRYNCCVVPVYDNENKIIGAAEISVCSNSVFIKTQNILNYISKIVFSVELALFIIILCIILFCLFPLKSLNECAERLAAGEMGIKAKVIGNNDVSALATAFNYAASRLEGFIKSIKSLNVCYKYYVPSEIADILGKSSISDIKRGDSKRDVLTVLYLKLIIKSERFSENDLKNTLNNIFKQIVPKVNENGGFINHFGKDTISIIFQGEADKALKAAISINQISNLNNIKSKILIHTSKMTINVIGNKERYGVYFSYLFMDKIKKLILCADEYNTSLIITQSIIDRISDFDVKFNARLIAKFQMNKSTFLNVYDAFDSDSEYDKTRKLIIKPVFEAGIDFLMELNYYDARKHFLNVLQNYPEDTASQKYFYICDEKLHYNVDIDNDIKMEK